MAQLIPVDHDPFASDTSGQQPSTRDGRPYVRIGDGAAPQASQLAPVNPTQRAFLNAMRGGESGGQYNVMHGGKTFDNYADHPRQPQPIRSGPNAGNVSTAAGADQFLAGTWDEAKNALGLPDFSPESQDRAATWLAERDYKKRTNRDLWKDIEEAQGDPQKLNMVGSVLSKTWTSLPGGIEPNKATGGFGQRMAQEFSAQSRPPQAAQPRLVPVDHDPFAPQGADFGGRFAGMQQPQNARQLAPALRRSADIALVGPETTEQAVDAFGNEAANTAFLNVPRNVSAGLRSYVYGTGFNDEYQRLKDEDEARARLNPKSAMAGTAAGIVGGALVMPGIGGAATGVGRAAQAGVTGALYAGAGEFLDSKDPLQAGKSAAIGGVAGTVLSPVADKFVGLFNRMKRSPADFIDNAGNLTPQARQAVIDAGVDPNVMQQEIARLFAQKGMNPAAAREAALQEFGIQATRGQATRNVSDQQFEQMAAKGGYGSGNQQRINDAFEAQQRAAQAARGDIQTRLGGRAQYDDALEAASAVQVGLQREAGASKQAASRAYDDAFSRDGGVNSVVFDSMSLRIRDRLTNGNNPVIIDEALTPASAKALKFIDDASALRAPRNLADPNGMPAASGILEVSLRGAEQTRKKLLAAAKAAATPEDARAVRSIIREYDDEILRAADDGLFSGSQAAIDKLKEARGLYRDYRQRFKSQGSGDDVGRAIEKIVERDATGAEVANLLFGKSAVGEKGVSVRLADRVKNVFGEQSDEFSAIKQGLWNRLTEKPEGTGEWGPQALGNRIAKMLNGDARELAAIIYTPQERAQMLRFAKALDSLVPNPNATNPSGSAGSAWSVIKSQMSAQNGATAALGVLGYSLGGWELAAGIGGLRIGSGLRGQIKDARRTRAALEGAPVEPMPRNRVQVGTTPAVGVGSGLAAAQDYGQ